MRLRNSSHGVCTSSTIGCISHSPPPLRGAPSRREPRFRFPCRGGACSSRIIRCVPIETGRRGAVPYKRSLFPLPHRRVRTRSPHPPPKAVPLPRWGRLCNQRTALYIINATRCISSRHAVYITTHLRAYHQPQVAFGFLPCCWVCTRSPHPPPKAVPLPRWGRLSRPAPSPTNIAVSRRGDHWSSVVLYRLTL